MDQLVQSIQDEVGDGVQLPDLMVNTKSFRFHFSRKFKSKSRRISWIQYVEIWMVIGQTLSMTGFSRLTTRLSLLSCLLVNPKRQESWKLSKNCICIYWFLHYWLIMPYWCLIIQIGVCTDRVHGGHEMRGMCQICAHQIRASSWYNTRFSYTPSLVWQNWIDKKLWEHWNIQTWFVCFWSSDMELFIFQNLHVLKNLWLIKRQVIRHGACPGSRCEICWYKLGKSSGEDFGIGHTEELDSSFSGIWAECSTYWSGSSRQWVFCTNYCEVTLYHHSCLIFIYLVVEGYDNIIRFIDFTSSEVMC